MGSVSKLGRVYIRPSGETGNIRDFSAEKVEIPPQPKTPAEYTYHEKWLVVYPQGPNRFSWGN